jgi:L-threonylcarbamoyladenylate synthase
MEREQLFAHIKSGGVFAYPTETLWGLGADIYDQEAVQKIFELKGRELSKAVSVLVKNIEAAKQLAIIDKSVEGLMEELWPGPITFVLPAESTLPKILCPNGLIGMRCTSDPVLAELVSELPNPIITTSANKSGEPAAHSSQELRWLGEDVAVWRAEVVLSPSLGSTVLLVAGESLRCLREGDFPLEKIKQVAEQFDFEVDA